MPCIEEYPSMWEEVERGPRVGRNRLRREILEKRDGDGSQHESL